MQTASRYPWGKGRVGLEYTSSTFGGATGLSMTVPAGKIWIVVGVVWNVTAGGGAGNRVIAMRISEPTFGTYAWHSAISGAVAAAQKYLGYFAPGVAYSAVVTRRMTDSTAPNVQVDDSFPGPHVYAAGTSFNLYDTANIAGTDAVKVWLWRIEYDA